MPIQLKRTAILIGLAACITACQPSTSRTAPSTSQTALVQKLQDERNERTTAFSAGLAAIEDFSKEPPGQCDTVNVIKAKTAILQLHGLAQDYVIWRTRAFLSDTQQLKWELQFRLADAALKQKCIDLAEGIYREIINVYTGNPYAGIRERARIGLDDVREARRERRS